MSVSCECCVLSKISAKGRSLVQRSPTECGVSECNFEASVMRRPWPTSGYWAMGRRGGEACKLTKIIFSSRCTFIFKSVTVFIGCIRKIAISDRKLHVCLSVRPDGTTRLLLDRFS